MSESPIFSEYSEAMLDALVESSWRRNLRSFFTSRSFVNSFLCPAPWNETLYQDEAVFIPSSSIPSKIKLPPCRVGWQTLFFPWVHQDPQTGTTFGAQPWFHPSPILCVLSRRLPLTVMEEIEAAEPESIRRVILAFHGNGNDVSPDRNVSVLELVAASPGTMALQVEYPGYFGTPSAPHIELLQWTVERAIQFLFASVRGLRPQHIVLFGHSLGTGIAVHLLDRISRSFGVHSERHIAGVILKAPFTSMKGVLDPDIDDLGPGSYNAEEQVIWTAQNKVEEHTEQSVVASTLTIVPPADENVKLDALTLSSQSSRGASVPPSLLFSLGRLLMINRLCSSTTLRSLRDEGLLKFTPILLLHGQQDFMIPTYHSARLALSASDDHGAPVYLGIFPDCDHNNVHGAEESSSFIRSLAPVQRPLLVESILSDLHRCGALSSSAAKELHAAHRWVSNVRRLLYCSGVLLVALWVMGISFYFVSMSPIDRRQGAVYGALEGVALLLICALSYGTRICGMRVRLAPSTGQKILYAVTRLIAYGLVVSIGIGYGFACSLSGQICSAIALTSPNSSSPIPGRDSSKDGGTALGITMLVMAVLHCLHAVLQLLKTH